jgi:hypothetical protein
MTKLSLTHMTPNAGAALRGDDVVVRATALVS